MQGATRAGVNQLGESVRSARMPEGARTQHASDAARHEHRELQNTTREAERETRDAARGGSAAVVEPPQTRQERGDAGPIKFKPVSDWDKHMPEALPG